MGWIKLESILSAQSVDDYVIDILHERFQLRSAKGRILSSLSFIHLMYWGQHNWGKPTTAISDFSGFLRLMDNGRESMRGGTL